MAELPALARTGPPSSRWTWMPSPTTPPSSPATRGNRPLLAVVKANAYGTGAVPVARTLEEAGARWLGVALVEEGVQLRRAGLKTDILLLGPAAPAQCARLVEHRITPAVYSLAFLDALGRGSRCGGHHRGSPPQSGFGHGAPGISRGGDPGGALRPRNGPPNSHRGPLLQPRQRGRSRLAPDRAAGPPFSGHPGPTATGWRRTRVGPPGQFLGPPGPPLGTPRSLPSRA